jgi:hypothetical protein
MNNDQVKELLLQALETEIGGVAVYEMALQCTVNRELHKEWTDYLAQTRHHVEIVTNLLPVFECDPLQESPGRKVVRHIGTALVEAMRMALADGNAETAELVATECVSFAETKDHQNWELIAQVTKRAKGDEQRLLYEALHQVEEEEDRHLYHTMGWSRELWIQSLGLPAVLPPPEEERDVTTEMDAARAKEDRDHLV